MATQIAPLAKSAEPHRSEEGGLVRPLQMGDRLSRAEFERRYAAMTDVKKAELVERVVYLPAPVSAQDHAIPHGMLVTVAGLFAARTPGIELGDNATVRLDQDNEFQPDLYLRRVEQVGGTSRLVDGFIEGPAEWIAEIAASSASYDLHEKLHVYRRSGVREYLVWRVWDQAINWFVLRNGEYQPLAVGTDGIYRSEVFPGLWLDPAGLLRRDMPRVLDVLQAGVASEEHTRFVEGLQPKPAGQN